MNDITEELISRIMQKEGLPLGEARLACAQLMRDLDESFEEFSTYVPHYYDASDD